MNRRFNALFGACIAMLSCSNIQAATWEWRWTPGPGEGGFKVEVCPLKYGKAWAYSVEIDDNPTSTLTVSQPLLARYAWNDAPPGVTGGADRPFVGAAAVIVGALNTGNETSLSLEQIHRLQKSGWGIVNHSYWHTGNHWDKSKFLKPEEFKQELFWSQALFANLIGDGRAATHFVFPNGDFYYEPYLTAYGLRSASRVSGSSPHSLLDSKANLLDWDRNYLDEGPWAEKHDAIQGLPAKPQPGDLIIDFTHGMDKDPGSPNQKRWVERLEYIARRFGPQGDNSVWVAPTDEVANYALAARAVKVEVASGRLTVRLPDSVPGSALTLKISGLNGKLKAPEGATLYRQGSTAWLTTPVIGKPGSPPPTPRLRRVYSGPVQNVTWDKPIAIAGVRIRQFGAPADGFLLKLDVVTPKAGVVSLLPEGKIALDSAWGTWRLYPTIPNRPAPLTKELRVAPDKSLQEMEVWALEN